MFSFLSLPAELVQTVIESVTDRRTLVSLACTCHTLQPLAEARLFHTIHFRYVNQVPHLLRVLDARPARAGYVQDLEVTPADLDQNGATVITALVIRMRKLKELKVESPLINGRLQYWWADGPVLEYVAMFERANDISIADAPLRHLTSFTFHSNGRSSRYYDIQTILPIFLSPTLRHIHVSCVSFIPFEFPSTYPHTTKTPLQKLVLDECDIKPEPLNTILSLPRALLSLSLQETARHGYPQSYLNANVSGFLSAISQQSDSLQYLQHTGPGHVPGLIREPDNLKDGQRMLGACAAPTLHSMSGLSHFKNLLTLDLDWLSVLTQTLTHPSLAPPSLQTYCLTGISHSYRDYWEHLPEILSAMPPSIPIRHLELHIEPAVFSAMTYEKSFMTSERANALATISRAMKQRAGGGVTTKLMCWEGTIHFKAPYLWGEDRPTSSLLFDSEEFWRKEELYEKLVKDGRRQGPFGEEEHEEDGTGIAAMVVTGYRNVDTWRGSVFDDDDGDSVEYNYDDSDEAI